MSRDFNKHVVSRVLDDRSILGWKVTGLWEFTKHMQSHKVSTVDVYNGIKKKIYDSYTAKDWKQVEDADLSYPIIRHSEMGVIDGLHRTAKAYNEGIEFIDVIDIDTMPKPDYHWKNQLEHDLFLDNNINRCFKLYHYSTDEYDYIKTLNQQNRVTKDSVRDYGNSASFLFERIPLDIGDIFAGDNPFWVSTTRLYEHEILLSDIETDINYHITESPQKTDLLYNKQDWTKVTKENGLVKTYLQQVNELELKLGYIGAGRNKLLQIITKNNLHFGLRDNYIKAVAMVRKYNEKENLEKYAALVPHVMLYPHKPIKVNNSKLITLQ